MKSTYLDSVWYNLILDAYSNRSMGMAALDNSTERVLNQGLSLNALKTEDAASGDGFNEWCRLEYPVLF